MQRVCFCKTVSLFNHVLQPSQAIAVFYQSLLFSLKNIALVRWISSHIDIPTGLQLLMIDINGNVTVDDELLYKQLSNAKRANEPPSYDSTSILKWISRIVLRLASDCSISAKSDRSIEFESFNEFLKQFHTMTTDDRSTLSDDDEGISSDDLDEEDISRRAVHRALMKCIDYITSYSMTSSNKENQTNTGEMQDFESNSIALYNQQIIQILCSDTLELEIELARDLRQSSFEISSSSSLSSSSTASAATSSLPSHDTTFYSVWAVLWRNVTVEYLQFNGASRLRSISLDQSDNSMMDTRRWSTRENDRVLDEIAQRQQNLKKTVRTHRRNDNEFCLHDRLMSEIKKERILKPIANQSFVSTSSFDSSRKRIRPVQELAESDLSSDDEQRDEHGRKRVAVIDCLLESSPDDNPDGETTIKSTHVSATDDNDDDDYVNLTMHNLTLTNSTATEKSPGKKISSTTLGNLQLEYISMDEIVRLLKDSSNSLSLTFDEFCHIRNVITRAELETLLFDDKLYAEVAQGKLCFTCRKVHFNLLTFTFGSQCNVCKQKVCRSCLTQIVIPRERLTDIPIRAFAPLTASKSSGTSSRSYSLDNQSPLTPVMNDIFNDLTFAETDSRRCSTPASAFDPAKSRPEPIDICTDCFFLLQQIRKKVRQRHVNPPTLPSTSPSLFNRSHPSSSRSTSNCNLSSSSSSASSSITALLAQQQCSFLIKSAQEVPHSNDPLQTLTTIGATGGTQRGTLSRRHLFLQLQPAYDVKLNNIKTG